MQYQEVPNPDDTAESVWDSGWRWWMAAFSAFICILIGLAVLGLALSMAGVR